MPSRTEACTCGGWMAERVVRGVPLCYVCAHVVEAHGADPAEAWRSPHLDCGCLPEMILPGDILRIAREGLTEWPTPATAA